ncbi:MAG TPA: neutral/alkaline non-lysosomal ceramidase N-terminal domain-containing protein [Bryobacteraceae bacterium]|nr:neutral/alkaline non-lysosomal ceramidase N-terminal domain-containing protein [Bryobacteraceae bacterium]
MLSHHPTRRSALLGTAAALLNPLRSQVQSAPFRIGIAETPITPSWPTTLWGYDNTTHYTNGVLDDIFAKAFLFENGKQFLVITLDVGAIGFDFTRRVYRRIHEEAKLAEDSVSITCTHDHSAPALLPIPSLPADRRFQILLEDKLVELAKQAKKNLTAATLEFGQIESSIGLNRRVGNRANTWNKDSGPIDPTFSVLLAKSPEGKNLGVLVNYPSHPVTLREDNDKVSADFPGVLYKELGSSLNCPVMYLQACCGDVIPKVFGGVKEMNEYGKKMAEEARRALAAAKPLSSPTVNYLSTRVVMTFVAPVPLDEFRANYSKYFRGSHYMQLWAENYLRYLEDGGDLRQSRDSVVKAASVGGLSFAFLPGEILHLTSVLIRKEFPGRKLIVSGYSNDTSVGYLPHADEFPLGKYEVEDAWKYYDTLRTTPQMEKDVRETAIALLRELTAGS